MAPVRRLRPRPLRTLLLTGGTLAAWSSNAPAATLTVAADGSATHKTISAAITAASSGDTIEVAPGTYAEVVDFGGKRLSIESTDGAASTIIDASDLGPYAVRLVNSEPSGAVLAGFTLTNSGAGALTASSASPTLRDLIIEGLGSSSATGGAMLLSQSTVSLSDSLLSGNTGQYGGHIYVTGGTLSLDGVTLTGGEAEYGGAIFASGGAALTLTDVAVDTNSATASGGGIYLADNGRLSLVDSTVNENTIETGYGGGIYMGASTNGVITDSTIGGNVCSDYTTYYNYGGGLYLGLYGALTLDGAAVEDNTSYYGGGLFTDSYTSLDARDAAIDDNYAYYGGGLWSYSDFVTIWDSAFTENASIYQGGGGVLYYTDDLDLQGTTFTENLAYYSYGGALYIAYQAAVLFRDLDFVENYAYYDGGAVYLYGVTGGADLSGLSFDANEAKYGNGGGLMVYYTADLSIDDSEFIDNTAYYSGGGAYLHASGLSADQLDFDGNSAEFRSGGGLYLDGAKTFDAAISASRFVDNEAGGDGGGMTALDASALTLSDLDVSGNSAGGAGGGLNLGEAATFWGLRMAVTDNAAAYGGGMYLSAFTGASADVLLQNSAFVRNDADIGGGACLIDSVGVTFQNCTLAANVATTGSGLALVETPVVLRNTAVIYNQSSAALEAWDALSTVNLDYSGWFGNSAGNVAGAFGDEILDGALVVTADPELSGDPLASGADLTSLVLLRGSPYVDAGDPSLSDVDASASDIGYWGGARVKQDDLDGDGISSWLDCDDGDSTAYPGAVETWYDGKNTDCLAGSDYDQDGDGVDAEAHGGLDCDDTDATVSTPCAEPSDTGGAADTGGADGGGEASDGGAADTAASDDTAVAPSPVGGTGCSCSASARGRGAAPAGLSVVLFGLIAVRRRGQRAART